GIKERIPIHKGLHTHRTARRYCHYCHISRAALARVGSGEGEGAADVLPLQHEADRAGNDDVRARSPRLPALRLCLHLATADSAILVAGLLPAVHADREGL